MSGIDTVAEDVNSHLMQTVQIVVQLADFMASKRIEALRNAQMASAAQERALRDIQQAELQTARPLFSYPSRKDFWENHTKDEIIQVYGVCRRFASVSPEAAFATRKCENEMKKRWKISAESLFEAPTPKAADVSVVPAIPGEDTDRQEWQQRYEESQKTPEEVGRKAFFDRWEAVDGTERFKVFGLDTAGEEPSVNILPAGVSIGQAIKVTADSPVPDLADISKRSGISQADIEAAIAGARDALAHVSAARQNMVGETSRLDEITARNQAGESTPEEIAQARRAEAAHEELDQAWDTLEAREQWAGELINRGVEPEAVRAVKNGDQVVSQPVAAVVKQKKGKVAWSGAKRVPKNLQRKTKVVSR